MTDLKVYWILCIFSVVTSDTIPSTVPYLYPNYGMQLTSYSNRYIRHIYEGDLMRFYCYLSSLGNPPITWTWFCGEEEMKNVTFSSSKTHTYMNFTATWKYDWKHCYCRAKSPSPVLFYDHFSSSRYMMRVFHSPRGQPMIYPLTPTTVQSGENIIIKCNLTTVGYPQITWKWICDDQFPQNGMDVGTETFIEIKATYRYDGKVCRCRGISSQSSFYAYDEISGPVKITVLPTTKEDSQCISAAAFGTTTGLLVAIILALIAVLLLQYLRTKKGNLCSDGISGKTEEETKSENNSNQNPAYVNDQSYEVLQVNRNRQ